MKKILALTIVMAGLAVSATAQKGSVLVYGDVIVTSKKNQDGNFKYNVLDINPGVGYQFNDNWTVGIQGGVRSTTTEEVEGADENKLNNIKVGPFLRYTKDLSETFFVFGQLDGSFVSNKTKTGDVVTSEGTGFNANVFPAIGVNIKNRFALNFSFGGLGFETFKLDGASESSSRVELNFGQVIKIGVSKNF